MYTLDELNKKLAEMLELLGWTISQEKVTAESGMQLTFVGMLVHTQIFIAKELEQINNNLEALRPEDNISKKEWEAFKADLRSRGM